MEDTFNMEDTPNQKRKLKRIPLSLTARKLLRALLRHQAKNRFVFRQVYRPERILKRLTTYGKIRTAAGVSAPPIKLGPYLGEIARFCMANHLPPLNALVVNGKSMTPGGAYEGTDWERDVFAALICRYPVAKELMPYTKARKPV